MTIRASLYLIPLFILSFSSSLSLLGCKRAAEIGEIPIVPFGDKQVISVGFSWSLPEVSLRKYDLELLHNCVSDFETTFRKPAICTTILQADAAEIVIISEAKKGPSLLRVGYLFSNKQNRVVLKFVIPDS